MTKKVIFIIFIATLCASLSAQKSTTYQEKIWIDSIFNVNFNKMQYAVDSSKMYDNYVDRVFVYFLSFISGIECTTIDYAGFCYFNKNKLEEWERWYEFNKNQISKETVLWGLSVLRAENLNQQQLDSLRSLRIPLKKE